MDKLDYFFNPRSVAVIGASRNPKKVGHVVFRNFTKDTFKGKIFPINPNADEILGYKCYSDITHIKEKIDLVIIAIPSQFIPKVLINCGKKKIPAAIILSGGFKEVGNFDLETKTKKIIEKYKMRAIGPNSLGVFDPYSGVDTIFNPTYKMGRPEKGGISFISQSGAVMSVIMDWMSMMDYKASKFISYGNALDVDESALLEYLAKDKKTKVIGMFMEGAKNGRIFFETAKKITKNKPIIALKGGITEEGKIAVSSHTGSMAGKKEVYETVFKQTGIIHAENLEQIFDFARVLATQPKIKGNRVQIITDGGGFGVLSADYIVKNDMRMAKMKKQTLEKMKKKFPPHVVIANPIDLTGDATSEMYREAITSALNDDNVDMIAVVALFQTPLLTADLTEVIIEASKTKKKPLVVISAGGRYTEVLKKSLEDNNVPCFSYPERAITALRSLWEYSKK